MAELTIIFGVVVLASGLFVLIVAGVALLDALEIVRVRRASVTEEFVGHGLLRGQVAATHGSFPAPFSELPCVFARTSVLTTDAEHRSPDNPASRRGEFLAFLGFGLEDDTGVLDVPGRNGIGGLDTVDSGPLRRLPDYLEDQLARRYGEPATLPPPAGQFRVLESTLLVGEEICATTFNYHWEREIRRVVVSVGKRPTPPQLKANFNDARALATVAGVLLLFGALFVAWGIG